MNPKWETLLLLDKIVTIDTQRMKMQMMSVILNHT
jgi:hypothetical protein